MVSNIGFIGFGLIAGSIAKAVKKIHPEYNIHVFNRRHPDVNSSLLLAMEEGVVTSLYSSLNDFSDSDVIFLCAPVLTNIAYLKELSKIIKPTCILTDVGSVKGNIHKAVQELGLETNFIGGHPMAGSDRTGYENSSSLILENAYYILTPTASSKESDIEYLNSLVRDMGALPYIVDYNKHDEITAAISHLPHIIASSLVNLVSDNDDSEQHMKTFAAGGFKDITRIASSSPEMWQSICLSNPDCIIKYIDKFICLLNEFKDDIHDSNSEKLYRTFEKSRDYRNNITTTSSGAIRKIHEIYVDVPDVPGIIAIIATILSSNSVNIKNIGIIHNREFEDGVLRIELGTEKDMQDAINALSQYSFAVHNR